jgi:hypothetical protein
MVIKDSMQGIVRLHPAIYDNGWTQTPTGHCYNHVRLNYQAGLRQLTRMHENVIVRLAHALMPDEPCGCDITQLLWNRDRKVSEVLSREMLNCPFGDNAGALFAFAWANQNAIWRGGVVKWRK